jgi:hypothetical protein
VTFRDDHDAALARAAALADEVERLRDERDAAVRDRETAERGRAEAERERDAARAAPPAPEPPPPEPEPLPPRPSRRAGRRARGWRAYGLVGGVIAVAAYLATLADVIGLAATGETFLPAVAMFPGSLLPALLVMPGRGDHRAMEDLPRWPMVPLAGHGVFVVVAIAWWSAALLPAIGLFFFALAVMVARYRRWT